MNPVPPSWIVKSLRAIHPSFSCAWDAGRQMWAITEDVRWVTQAAMVNGAPVFKMHRRSEAALRFKGLGSRILGYVRRNDPRKYHSVQEMVTRLKIDEVQRPQIPQSIGP